MGDNNARYIEVQTMSDGLKGNKIKTYNINVNRKKRNKKERTKKPPPLAVKINTLSIYIEGIVNILEEKGIATRNEVLQAALPNKSKINSKDTSIQS